MSTFFMSKVFRDENLKSTQKLVMLAIADNASDNDGETGTCFPSINTLAVKCGLSGRSIINNLDKLVESGYLMRAYRSRKSKGGRSSNKYLIYPLETMSDLNEQNAELFAQSEQSSYREERSKMKKVHKGAGIQSEEGSQPSKVKDVHKGSEGGSQGNAIQSEGSSQESEPSLSYNHQLTPTLVSAEQNSTGLSQSEKTRQVFEAYVSGMRITYGENINPVRNQTINSQLVKLLDRIGFENAKQVAFWYPQHKNSFYVQTIHAIGPMLKDCESLLIQVQSGRMVTKSEAYQADKSGHFQSQIQTASNQYDSQEAF